MAINKAIAKPPKSRAGLRSCLAYVLRTDKTEEQLTAITGPFHYEVLSPNTAFQSFMQEKKIWNKERGRMCTHNVISWHKDEKISLEEAFVFGQEFAENWFAGFQTVIAVHRDRDHIHCHMVTNSVSYEDGRKYHSSKKDLEQMKLMTNQMCRERNLTVAEKGKHFDGTPIEAGTVTAWNQDKYKLFQNDEKKSYVWECAMAVINAMKQCFNREMFIERMKASGWTVHWKDSRKHITFENEEGKKVRDSNLEKTFHLDVGKEVLEREFIRQRESAESYESELEQYYRQIESIDAGDVRAAEDSQSGTSGTEDDGQIKGPGADTETLLRTARDEANAQRLRVSESGSIQSKSESARRTSKSINRDVRHNESQSAAEQRERQLEEQRRIDAERSAREARRKNRRRSGPEL